MDIEGAKMPKIVVYSKDNCPFCTRAKNLLNAKGLDFEEINLEHSEAERSKLKERTGWRTFPQIFIDDELIGGFQELAALDARGELVK